MKIQWKFVYNRCTDRLDFLKNLNSFNVQNHKILIENRKTYQIVKIQWKIVYIKFANHLGTLEMTSSHCWPRFRNSYHCLFRNFLVSQGCWPKGLLSFLVSILPTSRCWRLAILQLFFSKFGKNFFHRNNVAIGWTR